MPTKISKTQKSIEAAAALPPVPKELIDQFCTGPMTGEAVNAATVAFKKVLIERALGGELSHHLGYARGDAKPDEATNHRNGDSGKTVLTGDGPLRVDVPRESQRQLRAAAQRLSTSGTLPALTTRSWRCTRAA